MTIMRHWFLYFAPVVLIFALGSWYFFQLSWIFFIFSPFILLGYYDALQSRRAVLRNFPIIGHIRYLLEDIRPEIQQYFVESDFDGRPIPRYLRSLVYQRSKGVLQTVPFGSQTDVYAQNHEWINHSLKAPQTSHSKNEIRISIGGSQCRKPYSASILNISAMSYGALSSNAVMALNLGAKEGRFYQNTGEGGLSSYHKLGGDIVWQIGTGYFGCRTLEGKFDEHMFQQTAIHDFVKMIEIKLSQGAKPGHGGILPGVKVTKEISEIRHVPEGKDVLSPGHHTAFDSPIGLLHFVQKLRELSGGKPVGFKLCVGKYHEFLAICKAMRESGIQPDFITVDGSEGGTGAAPLEFIDSVGTPLNEGLKFVHDALIGFGFRDEIKVIASGKIFTGFHIISKMALGADLVNSARGMMMALGCIQALRCNSNNCPVGITTSDPQLVAGLHVPTKFQRVLKYHQETLHVFQELLAAMGYSHPRQIQRKDIYKRMGDLSVRTYEELYPSIKVKQLINPHEFHELPQKYQTAYLLASSSTFEAHQSTSSEVIKKAI